MFSRDKEIVETNYLLNHERKRHDALYNNTIGNPSDIYRADSLRIGKLTLTTLDKAKQIISGTFCFEVYNSFQNKTIKITDGKFRLKYTTN